MMVAATWGFGVRCNFGTLVVQQFRRTKKKNIFWLPRPLDYMPTEAALKNLLLCATPGFLTSFAIVAATI